MGKKSQKRSAPRTRYSSTAIVFLANKQYTCRVTNLSTQGALMVSPIHAPPNTYLRINISLPGLDQILDLDGIVTRETQVKGYYAWGVKFHQPSSEATALIETFQKWVSDEQKKINHEFERPLTKSRPPTVSRPRPHLPSSDGLKTIQSRVTGPTYPRVSDRALKSREEQRQPARTLEDVEARWRQREEEQKAKRELEKLYRSALQEFSTDTKTKKTR
jgi:hypothetical protein